MSSPGSESTDRSTTFEEEMRAALEDIVTYIDETMWIFRQSQEPNDSSNEGGGRKENINEGYVYPNDISDTETAIYTGPRKKRKGRRSARRAPASALAQYTAKGEQRGWENYDQDTKLALLDSLGEEWVAAFNRIDYEKERDGGKWDSEAHALCIRVLYSKTLNLGGPVRNAILRARGSAGFDAGETNGSFCEMF